MRYSLYQAHGPVKATRLRQPRQESKEDWPSSRSARLHSAPKGLLRHYILHRIAERPVHGYEVIQDIESRTEGAWRPGAGSLYPILKKLESEGLIETDKIPREEATRRVYHITPKGVHSLAESKEMLTNFQHRWSFMRKIFIELIDPENVASFFVDNSNRQFQLAREILESKASKIPERDIEYILKEYALGLERQLSWAKGMISEIKPRLMATTTHRKGKTQ